VQQPVAVGIQLGQLAIDVGGVGCVEVDVLVMAEEAADAAVLVPV
jgi:hypothetical protein